VATIWNGTSFNTFKDLELVKVFLAFDVNVKEILPIAFSSGDEGISLFEHDRF